MSREYVGIDLHRRRSVIVRKNSDGEVLSRVHIDNDSMALAAAVSAARPHPEVVLEQPSAGTGPLTSSPTWAPTCTWLSPSATTGATGG